MLEHGAGFRGGWIARAERGAGGLGPAGEKRFLDDGVGQGEGVGWQNGRGLQGDIVVPDFADSSPDWPSEAIAPVARGDGDRSLWSLMRGGVTTWLNTDIPHWHMGHP